MTALKHLGKALIWGLVILLGLWVIIAMVLLGLGRHHKHPKVHNHGHQGHK